MPTNATPFDDPFSGEMSRAGKKISDTASEVRDKISDFGNTAAEKINENRGAAATGLDNAATSLRENARSLPGGEKVANIAQATAEKLRPTADYVRGHDLNGMMGDVQRLVKRNPGPSLLAAVVIGFVVGRALTSRD